MQMSRLEKLLESTQNEHRFSDSPYKVHRQRNKRFGFHENGSITLKDEVRPFKAVAINQPSPAEQEWRAMEEEIQAANYIQQIENDAEIDDFVPYSQETLSFATDFLRRQMIHAHAANMIGMGIPQIGPADHGSVDLFWEKPDRTLLVNFPHSGEAASYYGKKRTREISGRFDPSDSLPELVIWLAD
jgi:hypothetical protein